MNIFIFHIVLITILSFQTCLSHACEPFEEQDYNVSFIVDGDSIEVIDAEKHIIRVRLYGIDAPELSQEHGKESKNFLISLIGRNKVRLKTLGKDKYDRLLALVYIVRGGVRDDFPVNQIMIEKGHAWVYDYFCRKNFCSNWKTSENLARVERFGLWTNPTPVNPYIWRKEHRRQ